MARDNTIELLLSLKDEASAGLKKFEAGLNAVVGAGAKVAAGLTAAGAAAAALGFAKLGADVVSVSAKLEGFRAALTTITGSAEGADKALAWVKEFGAKTPYELEQVNAAFVKLSAYGLDAQKQLGTLGDTAAAMGKPLEDAVEMMADAVTGEFERLKEFGIRSKTVGDEVTFTWMQNGQEMEKTVKKTAGAIEDGLLGILEGRFKGSMEGFSQTWSGMWSNLKDAYTLFIAEIGEAGFFDSMKADLESVLALIAKWKADGSMAEWATRISDALTGTINLLKQVVTFFAPIVEHVLKLGDYFQGTMAVIDQEITKFKIKILELREAWNQLTFDDKEAERIRKQIDQQKEYLKHTDEIIDALARKDETVKKAAAEEVKAAKEVTETVKQESEKRVAAEVDGIKQRAEAYLSGQKQAEEAMQQKIRAVEEAEAALTVSQQEAQEQRARIEDEYYNGRIDAAEKLIREMEAAGKQETTVYKDVVKEKEKLEKAFQKDRTKWMKDANKDLEKELREGTSLYETEMDKRLAEIDRAESAGTMSVKEAASRRREIEKEWLEFKVNAAAQAVDLAVRKYGEDSAEYVKATTAKIQAETNLANYIAKTKKAIEDTTESVSDSAKEMYQLERAVDAVRSAAEDDRTLLSLGKAMSMSMAEIEAKGLRSAAKALDLDKAYKSLIGTIKKLGGDTSILWDIPIEQVEAYRNELFRMKAQMDAGMETQVDFKGKASPVKPLSETLDYLKNRLTEFKLMAEDDLFSQLNFKITDWAKYATGSQLSNILPGQGSEKAPLSDLLDRSKVGLQDAIETFKTVIAEMAGELSGSWGGARKTVGRDDVRGAMWVADQLMAEIAHAFGKSDLGTVRIAVGNSYVPLIGNDAYVRQLEDLLRREGLTA